MVYCASALTRPVPKCIDQAEVISALRRNPTACPKRHRFLRKGSLGSLGG
jgi:hypothetical protein